MGRRNVIAIYTDMIAATDLNCTSGLSVLIIIPLPPGIDLVVVAIQSNYYSTKSHKIGRGLLKSDS